MSLMMGVLARSGNPPVYLSPYVISDTATAPASAEATISFVIDGSINIQGDTVNPAEDSTNEYYKGTHDNSVGDDWDVMCSVISGDSPNTGASATLDTWLNMASVNRAWGLQRNGISPGVGSYSGVWEISFSSVGAASTIFSTQISVTVTVT